MKLELGNLKLVAGAALALAFNPGCGAIQDIGENPATGGSLYGETGGVDANTGGAMPNGGVDANTGGAMPNGGASANTGGAMPAGGAVANTGRAMPAGGAVANTGGAQNGTGGSACQVSCPAQYMSIYLDVITSTDGGTVSSVEVTFSGPTTGTMLCEPNDGVMVCRWPSEPLTVGSYSLLVSAPGFQSVNVAATVAISSGSCCENGSLDPSTVTLDTCTGPDCSVSVTCTYNGSAYAVGSSYSEGCTSCMCQSDGTWGMCTGACPDPLLQSCLDSGGTAGSGLCCASATDFPEHLLGRGL